MAIPNPFSSSESEQLAGQKAKVGATLARKSGKQQESALTDALTQQRQALAPALTNIGDIYNQEKAGRDIFSGALGIPGYDQGAAQDAYANYLQPVDKYGIEDLFRYGGQSGTTASGGTQKALYDYGYTTRFQPWLTALQGFNPLGANAQYGDLAGKLADIEGTYGSNVANVLGNKFNQIAGYRTGGIDDIMSARQGAATNVLNAGIAGVNALGNVAGMAINPAKALPSAVAQAPAPPMPYGGNTGTFPGWGLG